MANEPENQDLVKALESIRGLLEKSETKLSAARSSLEKAKQPSKRFKKPPTSNEPVVPVLDDIVVEGGIDDDDLIPVLEEEETSMMEMPKAFATPAASPSGHSTDEILAYIDNFEQDLEKHLHQSLIQAMVHVETEIKQTLHEQIQQLKDEIESKRND